MNIDYIGGFFDGEGSIVVTDTRVRVTIPQTNEDILKEISSFFGCGIVDKLKKRQDHWKDAWQYRTRSNEESYNVLLTLRDHLIMKKDKAYKACSILEKSMTARSIRKRKIMEAVSMVNDGLSYRDIEKLTGIGRQSICRRIQEIKN
jgi:bacterioferritin-associated ferredoxin